jgi:hypothetical protein
VAASLFVLAIAAIAPVIVVSQGLGPDWPQFRGPARDGAVAAFAEPAAWPERLTQQWKVDIGEGHASPILVGGRVYTFSRQGGNEVMQALDAATGKTVWQTHGLAASGVEQEGPLSGAEALHGGRRGHVGAAGDLRATGLRQGRVHADALGDRLTPARIALRRCPSRAHPVELQRALEAARRPGEQERAGGFRG